MPENTEYQDFSTRKVQDLVLLGLLLEGPKHGYELKTIVNERLTYLTEITSGTVYYTLKKLERNNLVTHTRQKEGERPERNVYEITELGRKEFPKLAKSCLFSAEKLHSLFNVGLYFMYYLDQQTVLDAIDRQLEVLEELSGVVDGLENTYPGQWPLNFVAIKERQLGEIEHLRKWHTRLKQRIVERARGGKGRQKKDKQVEQKESVE